MKVLKYLQTPSDLPWIIISQLILALAVAHFGAAVSDSSRSQEAEIQETGAPQKPSDQGTGRIYIVRMGKTPDECVVSSADGVILARMPTEELVVTSLDGQPVVDLSLSEEKQSFFAAISRKLQANNVGIRIAYKTK